MKDLVEAALSFGEAAELNTEIGSAQEGLTQAAINLYTSQSDLSSDEKIEMALPASGEKFSALSGRLVGISNPDSV